MFASYVITVAYTFKFDFVIAFYQKDTRLTIGNNDLIVGFPIIHVSFGIFLFMRAGKCNQTN